MAQRRSIQLGGLSIPKEERGPFVNQAFTLDLEAFELLLNSGKNRSRTVRRAIKHYCREMPAPPGLVEKFNQVCIERKELQDVVELQRLQIERLRANKKSALSRFRHWLFAPRA